MLTNRTSSSISTEEESSSFPTHSNPSRRSLTNRNGKEAYVLQTLPTYVLGIRNLSILTTAFFSKIPHHRRAAHLHGHDGLLQDPRPATTAPAAVHAEVRSCRYVLHSVFVAPAKSCFLGRESERARVDETSIAGGLTGRNLSAHSAKEGAVLGAEARRKIMTCKRQLGWFMLNDAATAHPTRNPHIQIHALSERKS